MTAHDEKAREIVMKAIRKADELPDPKFDEQATTDERCFTYIERGIAVALDEAYRAGRAESEAKLAKYRALAEVVRNFLTDAVDLIDALAALDAEKEKL